MITHNPDRVREMEELIDEVPVSLTDERTVPRRGAAAASGPNDIC